LIKGDMLIMDLLREYPQAREVLEKNGMACTGCMGAEGETIAGGARMHGIDVVALLEELNLMLGKK